MKTRPSFLVALLLMVLPLNGGDLIPFENFYVSVETNDWLNRRGEGDRLNVSVRVSRSAEDPKGATSVDINCFEFKAGQRMLPDADLKALLAAGDAAQEGKEFKEVVTTKTFRGHIETIYEVVDIDGNKVVRMSRGEDKAEFLPNEAAKVRVALARARSGEAWYKKLLFDDVLPIPKEEARAPQSKGYHLNTSIGTVSGRGIGYEVSVTSHSFGRAPKYNVTHGLCLYSVDGQLNGTLSGGWVEGLFQKITEALEAVNVGKNYSFKSAEDEGRSYSVTANLKTKEADIVLKPGKFFKGRDAERGHFGHTQLAEIKKLIKDCDQRIDWFQANQHMFFTKK